MQWTNREADFIEMIADAFCVDLDTRKPVGLGIDPQRLKMDRLSASLLSRDATERDHVRTLRGFAIHQNIDVEDEFWALKALCAAALQHPYFGTASKPDKRKRSAAAHDSDLHEWWIEANWLRAVLEVTRGSPVSDDDLATEMALRTNGFADWDSLGERDADMAVNSREYYVDELRRKKHDYESMLQRHNFDFRSMRANSTIHSPGHSGASNHKWGLSETEQSEKHKWRPSYKRIRLEQLTEMQPPAKP
tara:strand:- start:3652 stop:4398 length:747 start_codon:yes stop_codon:yes gene_type:complete